MARRRSFARRRLRLSFRRFARQAWQVVAVYAVAVALLAAFSVLVEPSRFVQGLVIGVVGSTLTCLFGLFFLMHDGNFLVLSGAWAEDFTKDQIKRAVKRGHVWGSVPNIELGGFDIDHLVVAPGGVLAVETKAHAFRLDPTRAAADRRQAIDAARKAESILRSAHVGMPREVTAVLAIMGRQATATLPAEGRYVDGVHVLTISHLADWLMQYRTGRLDQDQAEVLLTRLEVFKRGQIARKPVMV